MVKVRSAPEERQSELYLPIIRVHYYLLPMLFVMYNKTEVTSVKLVLFKYVMSFETLTKVDRLKEIVSFG